MADIPAGFFFNFFIFLFIPFLLALFFKKNKISPIPGYIIGGLIINNLFGNFILKDTINSIAYFGIILLLFTIGLEIQFEKMFSLKKFIVVGGLLQIIISILSVFFISLFFKFSFIQSLLIGIAFSSSSTSIVAKVIQDRGEESSFIGELAIGLLMFQDLAFIPFVIIFNSITAQTNSIIDIGGRIIIDMITSGIILWSVYYFGRKIVPFIFDRLARTSRELLNFFIILFIFFVAYVSTLLRIPILVSIFIAGILISQTLEHHHVFSQIRPIRDILAIIFFIYIGTNITIGSLIPYIPQILLFSFLVILVKALIILVVFILLRFNSRLSFYLSLYLFQIDEDAFILMSLGYANKVFTQEQYLFVISSVLLSLLLTPFLISKKEQLYNYIRDFFKKYLPFISNFIKYRIDYSQSQIDALDIKNHIIICGYGRIGSYIGRALLLANIPFIAIDYNFHTIEIAKREGVSVIYGDPTDINMLDYAEAEHAIAIVLAVPDRFSQEAIVMNAKKLNKDIVIISRVHRKKDHHRMKDLGVNIVVQPEFEASISIIKKLFLLKNIPKEEIIKKIRYFKLEQEGI